MRAPRGLYFLVSDHGVTSYNGYLCTKCVYKAFKNLALKILPNASKKMGKANTV